MRAVWTEQKVANAGAIMGLLIAIVLVTALAPTVINQSENMRALAASDRQPDNTTVQGSDDNTPYSPSAASIAAMYPLFWAIVGIAIIAGAVIAQTKGF